MTSNGVASEWRRIPLWLKLIGAAIALAVAVWNFAGVWNKQTTAPVEIQQMVDRQELHEEDLRQWRSDMQQKNIELQSKVNVLEADFARERCKLNAVLQSNPGAAMFC